MSRGLQPRLGLRRPNQWLRQGRGQESVASASLNRLVLDNVEDTAGGLLDDVLVLHARRAICGNDRFPILVDEVDLAHVDTRRYSESVGADWFRRGLANDRLPGLLQLLHTV